MNSSWNLIHVLSFCVVSLQVLHALLNSPVLNTLSYAYRISWESLISLLPRLANFCPLRSYFYSSSIGVGGCHAVFIIVLFALESFSCILP